MQAAACDQSNAFTSVRVPSWMVLYQGTPHIPAVHVWALLPDELRNRLRPHSMVSTCYRRLAMGSAHAVHILMMINLRIIGIAICSGRFLHTDALRPACDTHTNALVESNQDRASALSVAKWRADCATTSSQVARQVHVLTISFGQSELAPIARGVSSSVLGCGVVSRCTTGLKGAISMGLSTV